MKNVAAGNRDNPGTSQNDEEQQAVSLDRDDQSTNKNDDEEAGARNIK